MILFKEIKLLPSLWILDVYVTKDIEKLSKIYQERYAICGCEADNSEENEVFSIESGKKTKLNGEKRIVLCLGSLKDKSILVHELIHVLWHYGKITGSKIIDESQEWQAIFVEWLYNEILKDNYKKL